jgi:hypothetical protein
MSANTANKMMQRKRGASKRQSNKRFVAVYGGPLPFIDPDRVFLLNRRVAELTCYWTAGTSFNSPVPPGSSSTPFISFGTPFPDVGPIGSPYCVPFALNFSLVGLGQANDIGVMFLDFQVRALQMEIAFLAGDAYNSGVSSMLPELISGVDVTDANAPTTVGQVESLGNSVRQVLNQEKPHVVSLIPRPSVQVYGGMTADYGYLSNVKDIWYSTTNSSSMPFYGYKGVIRNWCSVNGSGAIVRFSATVQLALRRPH